MHGDYRFNAWSICVVVDERVARMSINHHDYDCASVQTYVPTTFLQTFPEPQMLGVTAHSSMSVQFLGWGTGVGTVTLIVVVTLTTLVILAVVVTLIVAVTLGEMVTLVGLVTVSSEVTLTGFVILTALVMLITSVAFGAGRKKPGAQVQVDRKAILMQPSQGQAMHAKDPAVLLHVLLKPQISVELSAARLHSSISTHLPAESRSKPDWQTHVSVVQSHRSFGALHGQ
jgi:hypothetical protein